MLTASEAQVTVGDLRETIYRLGRRLRKQSGARLTASQAAALMTLGRHGEMSLGELARREQISKSSVTRLASNLEKAALVHRADDPADRRSSLIRLSADGMSLLADESRAQNDYLTRQLEALSPSEQNTILAAGVALQRLLQVRC